MAPPPGRTGRQLVVEADGGSRGNPGPAGYGALVRDAETGVVLAEAAASIGRATNNVAEYSGLLAGLQAAAEIDPDAQVEVRMDSRLVVEQMSGRWQIKHEDMRRLARQARDVLPAAQVRYSWMPRARNSHADRLANEAMDAAAKGRTWQRRTTPEQALESAADALLADDAPDDAPDTLELPVPEDRLRYRLLTGTDDRQFCERVSEALEQGYVLHGDPAATFDGTRVVVAQAVVLPGAEVARAAARGRS